MPNVPVPAGGTGVSAIAYDMNYTYDQLGNRFTKIDAAADPDIVTTYHYDTDDLYDRDDDGTSDALPYSYQTRNNRLQYYEVRQGEPPASTLIEKCWYAYNRGGQVKRIVQQFPQSAHPTWYYERVFQYNIGQQLWLARGYHREDESCPEPLDETDYVVPDWIIEYRYDGDRGRYLTRQRDVETFEPKTTALNNDAYDRWTEYVNNTPYRDLEISKEYGDVDTMKRYVHAGTVGPVSNRSSLGYGLVAQYGPSGSDTRFFHPDLVGTTRMTTNGSGDIANRLRFSAFGEPLPLVTGELPYGYEQPDGGTRYGYAGSWGYQNDGMADGSIDIGLLHVGARYYESAIGRFTMRDPIGIQGGLEIYAYVHATPTSFVDPLGLDGDYSSQSATTGIQGQLQGVANPLQGLPRVGSALKTDPYYAFPQVVDNFASGATETTLSSGAKLYQLEGSLNGLAGRFEWIVNKCTVTHRFFVKGGTMNGLPIVP